ncbi:RDD family protein [Alteraurantiacibacter aestuarii]|uniref:RDD family protein n=1 Tax=Alteraurantiacibacter aestuarii TaxID=650004 RepID=A0A844ZNN9_9SPHN|nr:RDD family protein [Alteraurantiacibacter aestuarii]MXO89164.1 RDD family protein [Alteraurantiacibacter aestuarii]
MNAVATRFGLNRDGNRRLRQLVTPEGLALPLTIASRSARAGALLIDLGIIFLSLIAFIVVLGAVGIELAGIDANASAGGAMEFVGVLLILLLFLARYGYFLWFELGPRGATPGKRMLGIRVAARDGGRLSAEAVIARNLIRDVEVFLPTFLLLGGASSMGVAGGAAALWLAIFVLFPFFNKDALRAGDLVAGTWVVEAQTARLPEAMSVSPDRSRDYRFGEAELAIYGERELQVLEGVLRQDNAETMREVMDTICGKIGWTPGQGDEREFLEAFYAALRAHLERGMRLGRRKADKHTGA